MTKTDLIKLIMLKSIRLPAECYDKHSAIFMSRGRKRFKCLVFYGECRNQMAQWVSCLQNRHDVRVEAKSCGNFFP